ncbi:MAG TPA: NAD(P)-dependent oxidoreductase [Caulobacteraceae bacterium]|jgi:3-hydroxyisobutyrate dehydrogenase|nr:NAD(P)-dependent oxidoreductase [Caulobacteraceae bacterium]
MKIGFVGLGVMGAPMAGHLVAAGHEVVGFNRSPEKARAWAEKHHGAAADSLLEVARGRDFIVLCVGTDSDVREVVGAMLNDLRPGAILIDHTTTSAGLARDMAAAVEARECRFLDAPVSGGQAGAEKGQLSVMLGGDEAAAAAAEPVIRAYSKAVKRMGGPGAGQLTKMVNQICIAGVVQGVAEAVGFTARAGLDPQLVYEAISQGAAQSWQMDNRWATMARGEFEFGFAVDLMRKDLGLVLAEARGNGARLEITALVDQFYAEIQAMGGRRWDTSSLAARLQKAV